MDRTNLRISDSGMHNIAIGFSITLAIKTAIGRASGNYPELAFAAYTITKAKKEINKNSKQRQQQGTIIFRCPFMY